jgi:hypothetical protein
MLIAQQLADHVLDSEEELMEQITGNEDESVSRRYV